MGWKDESVTLIVLTEQTQGFSGIFGYSPFPGLGNLIFSLSASAGVDPYGNPYPAGVDFTGTVTVSGVGQGIFIYNGPPALGNLIGWWAGQAGTDGFGNAYTAGLNVGLPGTSNIELIPNANTPFNITTAIAGTLQAAIQSFTSDSNEVLPGILGSLLLNTGTATKMSTVLVSPFATTGAALVLQSDNDAATDTPVITIGTVTTPDSSTEIFAPIATFTPYAFILYGASSGQTVVTKISGSGNIPIPAGVTVGKGECWGSGSGGASQENSHGLGFPAAGGGGGEYACEPNLALTPGGNAAYVVPTGGVASKPDQNQPAGAGASATLTGSAVTVTAHGATAPHGTASAGTGGTGGTGSANTIHFNGGNGGNVSQPVLCDQQGAGGGSSAGTASAGNAGTSIPSGTQYGSGGPGGSAPVGGGAGGRGGEVISASGTFTVGNSGLVPGGGGGGGGMANEPPDSGDAYGGPGGNGQVKLTYSTGNPPILFSVASIAGTDQFGTAYPKGVYTVNSIVIQNPSTSGIAETWHTPTLQNSWTQRTGNMLCEYRMLPFENAVWIKGVIVPGIKIDGTTVFTLPSGYFDTTENQMIPVATTGQTVASLNTPFLQVNAAGGTVTINGANIAGLTNIIFNGIISLTSP